MNAVVCSFCNGTRMIKTSEGYKCRVAGCEGSQQAVQPGIRCEKCGELMSYRGLNSWGEPNYKCQECGYSCKL